MSESIIKLPQILENIQNIPIIRATEYIKRNLVTFDYVKSFSSDNSNNNKSNMSETIEVKLSFKELLAFNKVIIEEQFQLGEFHIPKHGEQTPTYLAGLTEKMIGIIYKNDSSCYFHFSQITTYQSGKSPVIQFFPNPKDSHKKASLAVKSNDEIRIHFKEWLNTIKLYLEEKDEYYRQFDNELIDGKINLVEDKTFAPNEISILEETIYKAFRDYKIELEQKLKVTKGELHEEAYNTYQEILENINEIRSDIDLLMGNVKTIRKPLFNDLFGGKILNILLNKGKESGVGVLLTKVTSEVATVLNHNPEYSKHIASFYKLIE
jgi:hypothetical protein